MLLSSAAYVPESDFPFEFSTNRGSIVTDDNVLTQSITSDGKGILKTNNPQPIIKYKSGVSKADDNSESTTSSNGSGNGYNKNAKIASTKIYNGNSKIGQNDQKKSSNINQPRNGNVVKGVYHIPMSYAQHIESSTDPSSLTNDDQWELIENLYKYANQYHKVNCCNTYSNRNNAFYRCLTY